jgi:uridine phosphorylase
MTSGTLAPFRHQLQSPSAFTPELLMAAVRAERGLEPKPLPPLCVLDFDGDLADHLAEQQVSQPWASWACFHTSMRAVTIAGIACGIVPRTIGGPYSVLISEQLWAAGAKLIVGLTSAGRVSPNLPLPSIVVVNEAIRDEGTSLHYVPPSESIGAPTLGIVQPLLLELSAVGRHVCQGRVWTTDAPYRETRDQLDYWEAQDALAVEMQAASLFGFAMARGAAVAVVALVSNSVDQTASGFDTGGNQFRVDVLTAIARAAARYLEKD